MRYSHNHTKGNTDAYKFPRQYFLGKWFKNLLQSPEDIDRCKLIIVYVLIELIRLRRSAGKIPNYEAMLSPLNHLLLEFRSVNDP